MQCSNGRVPRLSLVPAYGEKEENRQGKTLKGGEEMGSNGEQL